MAKDTQEELLVADAKLGNCIKEKFDIPCLANTPVQELMRGIRSQIDGLISGIPTKEMAAFALGMCELSSVIISTIPIYFTLKQHNNTRSTDFLQKISCWKGVLYWESLAVWESIIF